MADLTEEEKIAIAVCSSIAGLVIIGLIIFLCCWRFRRDRYSNRWKRDHYKERIVDSHRRDNHYDREYEIGDYFQETKPIKGNQPMYDEQVLPPPLPPLRPLPPPQFPSRTQQLMLPPPEPMPRSDLYRGYKPPRLELPEPMPRSDIYGGYRQQRLELPEPLPRIDLYRGNRQPRQEALYSYDMVPRTRQTRYTRDDDDYAGDAIVIPLREPEYISQPTREVETIYLKYLDDQALLPATNYGRRTDNRQVMRRRRSFTDATRSKYIGEWGHPIHQPWEMPYNQQAARAGRDPFLWK